jgi:hypothetical protein
MEFHPAFPLDWKEAAITLPYVKISFGGNETERRYDIEIPDSSAIWEVSFQIHVSEHTDGRLEQDGVEVEFEKTYKNGLCTIRALLPAREKMTIRYMAAFKDAVNETWGLGAELKKITDYVPSPAHTGLTPKNIDLSDVLHDNKMCCRSAWRILDDHKIVFADVYEKDGKMLIDTPYGEMLLYPDGNDPSAPRLARAGLGFCHMNTQELIPAKHAPSFTVTVERKTKVLLLLNVCEVKSRLTDSTCGYITLRYQDGEKTEIKLTDGVNVCSMYNHYASGALKLPLTEWLNYGSLLAVECDGGKVLDSFTIEADTYDFEFCLLSAATL